VAELARVRTDAEREPAEILGPLADAATRERASLQRSDELAPRRGGSSRRSFSGQRGSRVRHGQPDGRGRGEHLAAGPE
jgi:hypothetical protein